MPAGCSSDRRVIDGDHRPNRLRDVLAQLHSGLPALRIGV